MGRRRPVHPGHRDMKLRSARSVLPQFQPYPSQAPEAVKQLEIFMLTKLVKVGAEKNWSQFDREQAFEYVTSLLHGNGKCPTAATAVREDVEIALAEGCVAKKIPPNTVSGQQQPWFPKRLERAKHA